MSRPQWTIRAHSFRPALPPAAPLPGVGGHRGKAAYVRRCGWGTVIPQTPLGGFSNSSLNVNSSGECCKANGGKARWGKTDGEEAHEGEADRHKACV
eukprot:359683-Chlamydomonas_euryale.AAC.5